MLFNNFFKIIQTFLEHFSAIIGYCRLRRCRKIKGLTIITILSASADNRLIVVFYTEFYVSRARWSTRSGTTRSDGGLEEELATNCQRTRRNRVCGGWREKERERSEERSGLLLQSTKMERRKVSDAIHFQ